MKIKNAIISVSDKRGIVEFAEKLVNLGVEIYSTGGTAKLLKEKNIKVNEVAEYTEFPEILNGRVKTLHPKIFGGILAIRDSKEHIEQLQQYKIKMFDLVVVNLYPFENTISQPNVDEETIIENIDIGGVSLIRAAGKNFYDVIIVVDPGDYSEIISRIENDTIDIEFKKILAMKAFSHTARYDSLISGWFRESVNRDKFQEEITVGLKKVYDLRYGENPHQKAAVYKLSKYNFNVLTLPEAEKLQGKELSYNNLLDLDAALSIVRNFSRPACVIIKHNNPCGVAEGESVLEAYKNALSCDPVSAFGGILAFNREVDAHTAKEIVKLFTECIIAPDYSTDAIKVFSQKQDLRLLRLDFDKVEDDQIEYRQIYGGMLVQTKDLLLGTEQVKCVTNRKPTEQELISLIFAWKVAKYVKSNTIVLAKSTQTVGIGAGQMSRIDALKIAKIKMDQIEPQKLKELEKYPLVLASDAFFPFSDVVEEAAKIGVTAIIQPGGSIKDEISINAANSAGISMMFTGVRHFKH